MNKIVKRAVRASRSRSEWYLQTKNIKSTKEVKDGEKIQKSGLQRWVLNERTSS